MKSQRKFVNVLLTIIALVGLFGLTSYLVKKQQVPAPQQTPTPVNQPVRVKPKIQALPTQKPVSKKETIQKVAKPVSTEIQQVYRLQNKLKATKAAYEKLLNEHDSLKKVTETLQKPTQKAESGRDK